MRGLQELGVSRLLRTALVTCGVGLIAGWCSRPAIAQNAPLSTQRQHATALTGGRMVTGLKGDEGPLEWESATLVIRDGRIVAAGSEDSVTVPDDALSIDVTGLVVYPGFTDAAGEALLDSDRVPAPEAGHKPDFRKYTLAEFRHDNRRGLRPEFTAGDALEDPDTIAKWRAAGLTIANVVPALPVVGGRSAPLALTGAPRREALLGEGTLLSITLRAPSRGGTDVNLAYPSTTMGAVAHLRQFALDASHHALRRQAWSSDPTQTVRPPVDPALEAFAEVQDGELRCLFHASSRDEILRALDVAAELELQPAICGGRDAWKCIDRLKEANVPVLLRIDFPKEPEIKEPKPTDELEAEVPAPLRYQQDQLQQWRDRVACAARLHEAGVSIAFSTIGLDDPKDLLKNVRLAIDAGLPVSAAVDALTRSAADLIGLGEIAGSLQPGRLGNAVVLTGPLEDKRSKVRYVVIEGRVFEYNDDAEPVETLPADAGDAPKLAGRWQVTIETGDPPTSATLELTQTDRELRGDFESDTASGRVVSGSVKGTDVEFEVAIGAGDGDVRLKFTGRFATDDDSQTLSGTLKPAFGAEVKWTASRQPTAEEPSNIIQLSMEADVEDDATPPGDESDGESRLELPTELISDRLRRPEPTGGTLLVRGGTVLTGTGKTLKETSILIRDGRIAAIGKDIEVEEDCRIIDASGRFVTPGLIDTHSHIMISGGVNESTQSIVCEVRIEDVIESDDVGEYRALAGGLTTARLLHGSANVIGGQDAVVKLKHGLTARQHLVPDRHRGVKFALGENVKYREDRYPNTRMGVEATLKRAFFEAIDYRRRWAEYERKKEAAGDDGVSLLPPRRDLRLETLAAIVSDETFIHCHCYRADEILMLLRTAEQLGIRVWSLQHVLEGYKIAPEIAAHGASCSTFSDWWAYKVEAYDAIPHNAALLNEAGVNITVKSDNAELMRHMNLEAAKSLRYGNMSPEDALKLVTLHPARELGLDDRIGSIEVGKDGDLAIFNAHPFNAFSRCEMTIIEGEIWYERKGQPTAMSAEAVERSAVPPQWRPVPAKKRQRPLEIPSETPDVYAIVGATIHPVDAPPIRRGTVVVRNGRIDAVGPVGDVTVPDDAVRINARGFQVYPGLIDAGTTLGVIEIGRVRETRDFEELGVIQPDLRAGIAINVDSELIPVARAGGITSALIQPTGGLISGQCSLFQTAGWTSEEMVRDYTAGLALRWSTDEKRQKELEEFFDEARFYLRTRDADGSEESPIADPRFEAMRPYLDGERPVFVEAHSRKAIAQALQFAEEQELSIVITGGTDAWKLATELKQREVPVVVGPTMRSPIERWDPLDAPYANPGRLYEAGVGFCIRSDSASNSRNVAFEAARAVAYGLPEDEALKAITLNAARVLGIDGDCGSITVGKRADLIVTDGSPLQHATQIRAVSVGDRLFNPESKQTRLYERYLQRIRDEE
ncbi:amidohydrolase family protein [Maioricimonas sp. JC845]|uniref:amidohydrolase family protein n=1 Tax=Maioricimonas sp. JC845 TaxID=3232138 RepID=UPI00345A8F3D